MFLLCCARFLAERKQTIPLKSKSILHNSSHLLGQCLPIFQNLGSTYYKNLTKTPGSGEKSCSYVGFRYVISIISLVLLPTLTQVMYLRQGLIHGKTYLVRVRLNHVMNIVLTYSSSYSFSYSSITQFVKCTFNNVEKALFIDPKLI